MHPLLTRKFELYFSRRAQLTTLLQARGAAVVGVKKGAAKLVLPFRQLNAELIGSLVTLKGVVVRVTQVQPLIRVACYSCLVCGSENTQTVTGTQYTPLSECGSVQCRTNRLKGKLVFTTGASVFQPSQTVLIQETSDQVPAGSVPRSFIVRCTGVNVRACAPGE
jgi:DNA replication licensing factor MCM7